MANQRKPQVNPVLPWILAAVALVVYVVTLNHWVSISSISQPPYGSNSLAEVARVSGWTWQPALIEPLYWLITLPLKLLPDRLVPIALSIVSAILATATLWLLARSVAILPRDRTADQRSRESSPFAILSSPLAWVPPTAAVVVLGLQLSFWEHATVASGEVFKLFLFAYVVRCLLEYRLDNRPSWLYRATFVFAAGMTNSWGMIGYVPLFIAALIWLQGLNFFNLTFLSRAALFAFAGLLFYLLLPIVAAATSPTEVSFWAALKYNLGTQKGLLAAITFNKQTLFTGDRPLWVLGLPALLPLIFMSIRWPSYFGDPSKFGLSLATIVFHFFHGFLFIVCLWVMLDPQFSPRLLVLGAPLLSIYYLSALAIGYFAGYFLLIFGVKPAKRARPGLPSIPAINFVVISTVLLLLLLAPAAQLYRNLPIITTLNGPITNKKQALARQYADASVAGLPSSGGAIVVSDDTRKLALVRSAITARGGSDSFLFIDTRSLRWPEYHAHLEREYPEKWKNYVPEGAKGEIESASLVQVLFLLSQTNPVYYLHPSFGYYFEAFWMEPQGVVYRLQPYSTNNLLAPALSKQTIQYNQEFWTRADQNAVGRILSINANKTERPDNLADRLFARARLKKQENWDANLLSTFYSRARNFWGTEMQRARRVEDAEPHFRRAIELNENNRVAGANLAWNQRMQSGETVPGQARDVTPDLFGSRSWDQLINDHGPFDEPRVCFEQGRIFVRGNLFRQAAHQFKRVHELQPTHLASRLWLAQVYVMTHFPDEALALIDDVRSKPGVYGLDKTNALEIMSIETSALLTKNEPEKAEKAVQNAINQQPKDEALPGIATQIFMNSGHFTNAVRLLDAQLQRNPTNVNALINKGFAYLQMKRFQEAIPTLTRAMNLETNQSTDLFQSALFNRAIANLQVGRLGEARQDYEALQKLYPKAFKIQYGLAEVAYRDKDTNTAILNYQLYLANAPTNTSEAQFVKERLKELQGGGS